MMNLFSIFDPTTSPLLSLNWLSTIMIFFLLPYQFWLVPSRLNMISKMIMSFLFKEYKILLSNSFSNLMMLLALFVFIFLNNFISLFPYIFNSTSHMSLCFSLSFSFWMSLMIFSWINFMNDFFTHLVPQETPPLLIPFMVIIEFMSLLIRPLTLSIRLTINMITGHLILTLINSSPLLFNALAFIPILLTQLLLFTLELAVSLIQAYIFSILLTLYSKEI